MNEILLPTGVLDTTDEQPPIKVAAINIKSKEVILKFVKSFKSNGETKEIYSTEGYHMVLTYTETENLYKDVIYKGNFVIYKMAFREEIC